MAPVLKYTTDQMRNALKAVRASGIFVRSASIKYNVPRTTLSDKLKNKVPEERKMGPQTVLSVIEEEQLVRWIILLRKAGFPVTKDHVLDSVKMLTTKVRKETPFTNNRPGRHWYQAFMRRHPEILLRAPQNLSQAQASVTQEKIRNWFKEIQLYYMENNLTDVINDPRRVFNCDEIAFFLSPKGNQVLVKKDEKAVYNCINSNEKEYITTLMTGNAASELAPPMIMIRCKRRPAQIVAAMPDSWGLGKSDNGWMTAESCYQFVAKIFHPWLLDNEISLPVVLYVDGHSFHVTMALSDFCSINQIVLVALYPNSTHILQPMDMAIFRPLKQVWKNIIHDWRMEHNATVLKQETFPFLLKKAIYSIDSANNLRSGFRTCGLFPFDPNAINYSKLLETDIQQSADDGAYNEELHQAKKHLRYFESQQSSEKIETFEKSGDTWNGPVEDLNLFNYWISLKKKTGEKDSILSFGKRTGEIVNIYSNDAYSNVQSNTTTSSVMSDNTNAQNDISNLDQNIDPLLLDRIKTFEPLNLKKIQVIKICNYEETSNNDIVQRLNIKEEQVYEKSSTVNNSESSDYSAQEIGHAHDENSPSPTIAREISDARINYTMGSANEMAKEAAHPAKTLREPIHRSVSISSVCFGKVIPFKLVDIGEGIRDVTVKEWFVKLEDRVSQFDEICEVQSDKASVTITSRYDGVIKALHFKVNETALVGEALVDIEIDDDSEDNAEEAKPEIGHQIVGDKEKRLDETELENVNLEKVLATPAVRRIALENNINLKDVMATGKNGRVLKEDILAYLQKISATPKVKTEVKTNILQDSTSRTVELEGLSSNTVELKGYSRHMWKTMTKSLSIPHFVYSDECNVDQVMHYRNEIKDSLKNLGISLTFMPFFIKAASKALEQCPKLNAWLDEETQTLRILDNHNIGIAMDTPEGLVVPNIKNVQNLSVVAIAQELNRLQELGKKASIPLNDLADTTFSLSNIGVVGGTYTKPVILPPQVVIGAFGKAQKLPRYDDKGNIVPANIMSVSWAADHRVLDGVTVAQFSNLWKHYVENPVHLLIGA